MVKHGLKNKPVGLPKEFWVVKVIVDLFSKRKRENKSMSLYSTPEFAPNFPSTSTTANKGIKNNQVKRRWKFFAEGNTFNSKKRKCEDDMVDHIEKHEKHEIGKMGITIPIGKPFFSNFKVMPYKKICTPKCQGNEIKETALENTAYSIDIDAFLLIIKKQWGGQLTNIPHRVYLRFGRNHKQKGMGGEEGGTYSLDFPLQMAPILTDQLTKCFIEFDKKQPGWFSKMEAYLRKKRSSLLGRKGPTTIKENPTVKREKKLKIQKKVIS